jgi:hypothetical protein
MAVVRFGSGACGRNPPLNGGSLGLVDTDRHHRSPGAGNTPAAPSRAQATVTAASLFRPMRCALRVFPDLMSAPDRCCRRRDPGG